jgi:hypothetical protein
LAWPPDAIAASLHFNFFRSAAHARPSSRPTQSLPILNPDARMCLVADGPRTNCEHQTPALAKEGANAVASVRPFQFDEIAAEAHDAPAAPSVESASASVTRLVRPKWRVLASIPDFETSRARTPTRSAPGPTPAPLTTAPRQRIDAPHNRPAHLHKKATPARPLQTSASSVESRPRDHRSERPDPHSSKYH